MMKKRETAGPDEDIEALISPDDDCAHAPATSSKPAIAKHLQHNPLFVARLVLRKVGELITSDEDEDNIASSGGIITFLRDIVIGIVFGLLTVSFLIFLDHKDVIHLQSAHNYRNAAFAMVQDPETRTLIEESSGLIFMGLKSHETNVNEIAGFPGKIKVREEKISMLAGDLEVAKKEHAAIKPGCDILPLDRMLGLGQICGECIWRKRQESTYSLS